MGWCRYRYPKSPRLTFYKASFWVSIRKFPGCTNATLHRYTPPQPRSNIFVNMGSSSPLCWGEHWKIYVQPPPSRPHSKTHQQPFESMYLPIENGVFFPLSSFFGSRISIQNLHHHLLHCNPTQAFTKRWLTSTPWLAAQLSGTTKSMKSWPCQASPIGGGWSTHMDLTQKGRGHS